MEFVTSQSTKKALFGPNSLQISSTIRSPKHLLISAIVTAFRLFFNISLAHANPIPLQPPVTIATLSFNKPSLSFWPQSRFCFGQSIVHKDFLVAKQAPPNLL